MRLGHANEVEDRLHALAADSEPEVAVPAATSRVAVRHSVREPAASIRAAPPFAGLEAHVAARGKNPRQGRQIVKITDHLPPRSQERRMLRDGGGAELRGAGEGRCW